MTQESALNGLTLDKAYKVCRSIARREAKNFYYAFIALPTARRNAICSIYAFMRRADGGGKVFAGTATGIEIAAPEQPAPGGKIDGPPLALHIGGERTALVRSLEPANSQPTEVFKRGLGIDGLAAVRIKVFHAHDERATCLASALPCGPEGAGVAYVQVSSGRRRKPASISRRRRWSEACHTASSLGSGHCRAYGQFDSSAG